MKPIPIFKAIPAWALEYGRSGAGDQRGLEEFMICEAREGIMSLKNELIAITNGTFHEPSLRKILGPARAEKYGGFEAWAKMMLLWMANHRD